MLSDDAEVGLYNFYATLSSYAILLVHYVVGPWLVFSMYMRTSRRL